jgi:hypothetical protein
MTYATSVRNLIIWDEKTRGVDFIVTCCNLLKLPMKEIPKLGDNFPMFKERFLLFATFSGFSEALTSLTSDTKENAFARFALLTAVKNSSLASQEAVRSSRTAKDAWSKLVHLHEDCTPAQRLYSIRRLIEYRMTTGMSLNDHVVAIDTLARDFLRNFPTFDKEILTDFYVLTLAPGQNLINVILFLTLKMNRGWRQRMSA